MADKVREWTIARRIRAAGLPTPLRVTIAKSGASIAAAFQQSGGIVTFEGFGDPDGPAVDDVIRQFQRWAADVSDTAD